jgi:hypothetical protein
MGVVATLSHTTAVVSTEREANICPLVAGHVLAYLLMFKSRQAEKFRLGAPPFGSLGCRQNLGIFR